MSTSTYGTPLLAMEGETAALTTAASYLLAKPGFTEVKMYCASQWRLALSPALLHCVYYDAAAETYTEYRTEATDRVSATHVPLDSMPATDFLYLGFSAPALGVYINVDGSNYNDVAASLVVKYCSKAVAPGDDLTFTDVGGDNDGTDASGDTLKQDGVYTWNLPAEGSVWKKSTLGTDIAPLYAKCYWIKISPSATLSAAVDLVDVIPVYQNTDYGYMEPGVEYQWSIDITETSGFLFAATAGTPTLDISWIRHR